MPFDTGLVSMYDEYRRSTNELLENECTSEFLTFLKNEELNKIKWRESVLECKRLKGELDNLHIKISDLEKKLNRARVLLDSERKRRLQAESQRDELREHVAQIDEILSSVRRAGDKLANETREKLDKFLSTTQSKLRQSGDFIGFKLDTINEVNSTARIRVQDINSSSSSTRSSTWSVHSGSLLSDLSNSRSQDNIFLDTPLSERGAFKKPRRSLSPDLDDVLLYKKRRPYRNLNRSKKIQKSTADHIVATTTVTVPKAGPIVASSKVESFPELNKNPSTVPKSSSETDSDVSVAVKQFPQTPSTNLFYNNKLFTKAHDFRNKTMLKPSEECGTCFKKISFSHKFIYCPDCRAIAHPECRNNVSLPCITAVDTPRGASYTTISDFCGRSSPMIPPLIVHCVIEVESRGLSEVGIYRIPGAEKEVRALKDRFLRGKGACSLSGYDIHVICGTIKDFLRSLSEPLVTSSLWSEFIRSVQIPDPSEKICALYQVLAQLPQPNRDTLAFMMLHLQRVAESSDCKMSKSNLAKVFGPTIVGYSSLQLGKKEMFMETNQQTQVIQNLLDIPSEYWHNFVNEIGHHNDAITSETPVGKGSFRKRREKKHIFNTPPLKC